jgi:ABC-type antimicrobial peptide transport system permease subunit
VTFSDTMKLSLRNLRQAKLRTALTTLGVSIGIASLAGMVSLGVGLQEQVVGRFMRSGLFDSLSVTSPQLLGAAGQMLAARNGLRGRGGAGQRSESPPPPLNEEALKLIAGLPNVREAYPNLRIPVQLAIGDFERPLMANSVPMSAKNEGAFQTMSSGTFFTAETDDACLLSLDMAKQIAPQDPTGLVGKSAKLSYAASHINERATDPQIGFQVQRVDLSCRVVGVVERDPGPLPLVGGAPISGVMIPLNLAKKIDAEIVTNAESLLRDPAQTKSYGAITVKVTQARFTQDVEDRIRQLGFTVFSVNDALREAKNAFILLDIILSLIGSIALAVSSLGIVNTMVMSILERTREIGIMKAIGGSDNDIRRIFLIEASAIGLMGGLLGIALGWSVGRVIDFGANLYIRSQGGTTATLFSLPLWLTAAAIAFSVLVSLIAGSYPASRAARLDPIHALRHD